eukprot:SAG31_NODE_13266_length_881_cov_1.448849_2_plen_147_part_01
MPCRCAARQRLKSAAADGVDQHLRNVTIPLLLDRLAQVDGTVACIIDGGRLCDLCHEYGLPVGRLGLLTTALAPAASATVETDVSDYEVDTDGRNGCGLGPPEGAAGRHLHEAVLVEMASRGLRDLFNLRLGRTAFNDAKFGRRVLA